MDAMEENMAGKFINGYALLIGVNENINLELALSDVAKDVSELQKVFVHPERCAYLEKNVEVILGPNSTRANILGGLTRLKKKINDDASGNATAIVFYSGHGDRDDGQPPQYFLIPYDVDEEAFKSSVLRAEDFADAINALKPQRLLVILDCCRSGGMGIKGFASCKQSAIPAQIFMSAAKGVTPKEGAKGLEVLTKGAGRAVLSSSQGEQRSYMRKDGKMSIFTYHLIEALTGHAQTDEGAKEVLVSDVMSYVWRNVPGSAKADWGQPQEPDYQVSGNFPIALLLGGKGVAKSVAAPDPLTPLPQVAVTINTGGGRFVGTDQHSEQRIAGVNYYEARDHSQMTVYQTPRGAEDPLKVFDKLIETLDRLDLPAYEKRKARHHLDGARLEAESSHKDEAAHNLKQAATLIRNTLPSPLEETELGKLMSQCLRWTGMCEDWLTK
jgi:hypothetical protein